MSRKKAPPRAEPRFLPRDPAHCSFGSLGKLGGLSVLMGSLLLVVRFRVGESGKPGSLNVSTMVLSELVAYGYFWLSERA